MEILFYGDPHGEFEPLLNAVHTLTPKAVVILGDLQCQNPLHQVLSPITSNTDVWFIHGNHDTDSDQDYSNLFNSQLAHKNLHGRVETIAGLRVAGLGGVFRGEIWYPKSDRDFPVYASPKDYKQAKKQPRTKVSRFGGMPRVHQSSIWFADFKKLSSQRADILVTHEAPSCHRYGFLTIDKLAQSLGVNKVFHGHHHQHYESVINTGSRVITVHGVTNKGIKTVDGEPL